VVSLVALLWGSTAKDRGQSISTISAADKTKKLKKGQGLVDAEFYKRVQRLLKIVVPNYSCKESKYIAILSLLLVLRTQMSIWLADVNGKIVKSIVERDFNKFVYRIFNLMLFAIPSSAVNSGLDYFQKLLSVSFRERITEYFHERYLEKMFYYKICNLDSRISNPDQRLT